MPFHTFTVKLDSPALHVSSLVFTAHQGPIYCPGYLGDKERGCELTWAQIQQLCSQILLRWVLPQRPAQPGGIICDRRSQAEEGFLQARLLGGAWQVGPKGLRSVQSDVLQISAF